ncbi:hypothetical protein DK847_02460 [Aestuariivirga litoralis]|uniref:Uncharacterized protein n=1 Tax=Aestuariivirga litoralis TaxID=2650924 RepID=A0A2W2ATU4_9HYPH|nr:DUF4173 domain-containing protein [Aestuariivirga litoralis]PZF78685.1 hypothetical protein DK847_02460 [Aestuariivirga litoralis]
MTDVPAAEVLPRSHSVALRFAMPAALAGLTGIAWQAGLPGSVIAAVPAGLLLLICTPLDWPRRSASFKLMLLLAVGAVLAIALEPGPLNLAIGWCCLALLMLMARGDSLANPLQAVLSMAGRAVLSPISGTEAARQACRTARAGLPTRFDSRTAIVPLLSVMAFTLLFMSANQAFSDIMVQLFDIRFDPLWLWTLLVSLLALLSFHAILAMQALRSFDTTRIEANAPSWHDTLFAPGAVIATLAALNGVFLLQNVLDAQYLWSGMLGTPGNGYAAYAQQGAFTLIATVLLAAGLIIISLWPGSRSEASPAVRLLVLLWILQNGFLLASSAARLSFYIDAYGLTLWRLASLIWMGLVACGLVLVALRIFLGRSNLWLVNANLAAGFLLLWASGFVDFAGVVANHNAAWGMRTNHYDTSYMASLGPSALPALRKLTAMRTVVLPENLDIIDIRISHLEYQERRRQADWRSWTLRGELIRRALATDTTAQPLSAR